MKKHKKPPLWSWEIKRDVPATKDRPRFTETITYHRGKPHSQNRQYILPPGSDWDRSRWRTQGKFLDEPTPLFEVVMVGIIVTFWFVLHVLTDA